MRTPDNGQALRTTVNVARVGKIFGNGLESSLPDQFRSLTAWLILDYLNYRDEPVRQVELVGLGASKAHVSEVTDGLCGNGLAYRIINEADRRSRLIGITPTGIAALDESNPMIHATAAVLLNRLDDDAAGQLGRVARNILSGKNQRLWLPGQVR